MNREQVIALKADKYSHGKSTMESVFELCATDTANCRTWLTRAIENRRFRFLLDTCTGFKARNVCHGT